MPYRILLVDDNPILTNLIQADLEAQGYHVLTADCYDSVTKHLAEAAPDLILLDTTMPDVNGWELCFRLCEHSGAALILIASPTLAAHRDRAGNLQHADLLVKPFSAETLIRRIRVALEKASHISAA